MMPPPPPVLGFRSGFRRCFLTDSSSLSLHCLQISYL